MFRRIEPNVSSNRGAIRWVPSASLGAPEQRRSVVTEELRSIRRNRRLRAAARHSPAGSSAHTSTAGTFDQKSINTEPTDEPHPVLPRSKSRDSSLYGRRLLVFLCRRLRSNRKPLLTQSETFRRSEHLIGVSEANAFCCSATTALTGQDNCRRPFCEAAKRQAR
jgi:hypothetical protein